MFIPHSTKPGRCCSVVMPMHRGSKLVVMRMHCTPHRFIMVCEGWLSTFNCQLSCMWVLCISECPAAHSLIYPARPHKPCWCGPRSHCCSLRFLAKACLRLC